MLKNNFLKAVFAQATLIIANSVTGFLFVPYLLKTVGSEAYGFYPLSKNIIGFSTLITTILTSFLSKFITVEYLEQNYKKLNIFFNSSLYGNVISGLVVSVPLLLISLSAEKLLEIPEYLLFQVKTMFVFISVSFFTSQLKNTFSVASIATDKRYLNTYVRAFEKITSVLFVWLFFTFIKPSVIYVGLAVFTATLLTFFITVKIQKKIMPRAELSKEYVEKQVVRSLITAGGWHSLSQISTVVFSGVDILLANIYLGTDAQALCSLALVIPNLLKSAVIYLTNWLLPFLSVLASDDKKTKLSADYDAFVKYMSVAAAVVISIVIGFGDIFLKLWLGNFYSHKLYLLLVISGISLFIYAAFTILNTILLVHNHPKMPAFITVLAGILNIPLSFFLVKFTGVYGILLSTLILNLLVYAIFIPRYLAFRLKLSFKSIYKSITASLIVLATGTFLCMLIKNFIILNTFLRLLPAALAVMILLLTVVFIWILSVEDFKFIIEIIKAKINYGNDADEIQSKNDDSRI